MWPDLILINLRSKNQLFSSKKNTLRKNNGFGRKVTMDGTTARIVAVWCAFTECDKRFQGKSHRLINYNIR